MNAASPLEHSGTALLSADFLLPYAHGTRSMIASPALVANSSGSCVSYRCHDFQPEPTMRNTAGNNLFGHGRGRAQQSISAWVGLLLDSSSFYSCTLQDGSTMHGQSPACVCPRRHGTASCVCPVHLYPRASFRPTATSERSADALRVIDEPCTTLVVHVANGRHLTCL